MKRIAPGVYDDGDGGMHLDIAEMLEGNGFADTPENRAMLEAAAREMFGGKVTVTTEPVHEIRVGSLAVATRTTGVCKVGERGVCYEVYRLDGRPGYSFIFQNGGYDGFSPHEVDTMLRLTGEVAPSVAGYRFENVMRLEMDYARGLFAEALRCRG